MKKNLRKIWAVLIVFIFFGFIYNSKREFYENNVAFYNKNLNGNILKIVNGRGTKVYYSAENYFYLDFYKGIKLEDGNSFQKTDNDLKIYKKTTDGKLIFKGVGEMEKPQETYFKFFFNLY